MTAGAKYFRFSRWESVYKLMLEAIINPQYFDEQERRRVIKTAESWRELHENSTEPNGVDRKKKLATVTTKLLAFQAGVDWHLTQYARTNLNKAGYKLVEESCVLIQEMIKDIENDPTWRDKVHD
jgi:hypothetical protein